MNQGNKWVLLMKKKQKSKISCKCTFKAKTSCCATVLAPSNTAPPPQKKTFNEGIFDTINKRTWAATEWLNMV